MIVKQRIIAGALLIVLCGAGFVHGMRASLAQSLYHQSRYGVGQMDVRGVLRRCESAHRLYPHNYYFTIYAGERAYLESGGHGRVRDRRLRSEAGKWAGVSMALNPYRSSVQLLNARLKADESISDAIAIWDEFVDWHFWEPYHHLVRVELYTQAGMLEEALEAQRWTIGSRYAGTARKLVQDAWLSLQQFPDELIPGLPDT